MLTFDQVPIDWSDLRFLMRSAADAMRTHDAIETEDYRRVDALTRDAERLARRGPRTGTRRRGRRRRAAATCRPVIAGLEPLLLQAMRPFLSRCADAVMARTIFGGWSQGNCPLCGGEPDFSLITPCGGAPAALLALHVALALPSARVPVLR